MRYERVAGTIIALNDWIAGTGTLVLVELALKAKRPFIRDLFLECGYCDILGLSVAGVSAAECLAALTLQTTLWLIPKSETKSTKR